MSMDPRVIRTAILVTLGLCALFFAISPSLILSAVLLLLIILLFLPVYASANDWIRRGNASYLEGNYQAAIGELDRAIRLSPNSAIAHYTRGIVYAALRDEQRALEDLNRTLQQDPNFAQAYAERGIIQSAQGNHQDAVRDCDRAIQLNPKYVRAYFGRGSCRSYQGDVEGAISDFLQQIRLQPTAAAYYNIGVLYYQLGDYTQAIANLTTALNLDSNLISAYYNRGNARYDAGDEQTALEDYRQAMQLETIENTDVYPDDEHGFFGRGLAQYRLGTWEGAIADLQYAAQICQKHQNSEFHQIVVKALDQIQPQVTSGGNAD